MRRDGDWLWRHITWLYLFRISPHAVRQLRGGKLHTEHAEKGLPKHRKSPQITAKHRKSPQFSANQVQVTSMMQQLTANQYKHRKSPQITTNNRKSVNVRISWTSYATYQNLKSRPVFMLFMPESHKILHTWNEMLHDHLTNLSGSTSATSSPLKIGH